MKKFVNELSHDIGDTVYFLDPPFEVHVGIIKEIVVNEYGAHYIISYGLNTKEVHDSEVFTFLSDALSRQRVYTQNNVRENERKILEKEGK